MTACPKFSISKLFVDTFDYCYKNVQPVFLFVLINAVFFAIGFKAFDGWHDGLFLIWLALYYVYWFVFFRFYFGRKPLMGTKKIFDTLLPTAKIFVLMLVVMTLLLVLPLVPLLFGYTEWLERYLQGLQKYMEESETINFVTILIFTLIFPLIYYRPMLAWIGSVIGRSGVLSTAFARTKGCYIKFLLLTIVFNSAYLLVNYLDDRGNMDGWLNISLGSVLVVIGNIALARVYEYFFLEIDK